jgi:signal transduction histidine kinase
MSKGRLGERVDVERDDEIGLLARAFNRMAAELQELYMGLEAKVKERTRQLAEATERARRHAMRLAISAEVAQIVTSIRDLDTLLTTVAQTIANAFDLSHVSIYFVDEEARWAVRQAGSANPAPGDQRIAVGGPSLVGQVAADGQRRLVRGQDAGNAGGGGCELAVPLRIQDRLLGVIDLRAELGISLDQSDELVYQSLADQISIAIENARAYAIERETVARLRELDRIQAEFLTNMSHALRTPLNSIIGFSRILLKEWEGPLTEVQQEDLTTIYQSGRQLLGLINDMLELSHLEIGTAPFSLGPVNLAETIDGVMATARALALGKPVRLYLEVPDDLPVVYTDGQRVRQVILALLSNAVKFTEEGAIRLQVTTDPRHVTISVRDTGVGIPPEERTRILADRGPDDGEDDDRTPGFGLAISKRVVERLGGEIWVESEAGAGSTFTFTLPIRHAAGQQAPRVRPVEEGAERRETGSPAPGHRTTGRGT